MARFFMFVLLACLALGSSAQDQGTNYNAGDHGRSETVSADGEVQGQYHYNDADGKLITVKYRAGKNGFEVEGDHLPKAPQPETPQPAQQPFFQQQQQQQPQYYNNPQQQQNQFFNNQPQQQFQQQQQQQQPIPQLFQNFGQPQQQQFQPQQQFQQQQFQPQQQFQQQQQQFSHPNALQQGQAFQPQQQYYNQGQQQGQYRPSKVSVSQNPGSGFTYNIES